jgi:uncharacterized membrane protein YeaQ/YmgE (transglycosylase-associated protein family)
VSLAEVLVYLLVAGVCGSLARSLAGSSRGGILTSIVLGFIGALLGSWMGRALGVGEILALRIGDRTFPIVWSIIGAALFVAALHLIMRPRMSA